jgi:3-hydroxyisobutyrate dehydrogenase
MNHVAFLGTGLLGAAMVERMLAQGDAVTVWNRTVSKAHALQPAGAVVAPSAADAVAAADHVHVAVTDDVVVDAILSEITPKLRRDAIVMDHSTTSPAATVGRAARLAESGVRFLHTPVFMSPQMCRDGKGLIMVSGPSHVFDAVQAALARMTGDVWYLGERADLAAAYKLFGNSMIFAINAGLTDVLLMIESAGDQPLIVLPALATRMDEAIAAGHGKDDLAAIAAPVVLGQSAGLTRT